MFGKPDFVFPRTHTAVFVDGCFWHVCPRKCKPPPQTNAFWAQKLRNNRLRDSRVNEKLQQLGWRVIRIWEHELHNDKKFLLSRKLSILNCKETQTLGK